MSILYDRIYSLCTQSNITPCKMCSEIGISRSAITDLKAGRKKDLNATTAYKIAKYFGVSVGYLLGFEDK
ncbi:MAG: helix-turn-helix transcriptional regulator [Oscillospiraceae bacterium]|nr:helix-turn-helix transcriptional regulator [Oscillospiraceae bacterium]